MSLARACRHLTALAFALGLAIASSFVAPAADPEPERGDVHGLTPKHHAANRALARERDEALRQRHRGDTNVLVLPGVLADRTRRRVEIAVERSAVAAQAPCEFLVLAESSDHTYETLLIAFARPSDVHRALVFLGLPPGQPSDPGALRRWGRGESLALRLEGAPGHPIPPESWLADRNSGRPLPENRYLFTGLREARDRDGHPTFPADEEQPQAIAALFNLPSAVFEIAHRARKDVVYQNTVIRPDAPTAEGLLTLVCQPVAPAGQSSLRDLSLTIDATPLPSTGDSSEVDRLRSLRTTLRQGPEVLLERTDMPRLLERLAQLDRARLDWFLTVRFEPGISLLQARAAAGVLALIDSDRGVRIEPPPTGRIGYQAFTPDRSWLDRTNRLTQPLELVLEGPDASTGRLFHSRPRTRPGTSETALEVAAATVPTPADLRRASDAFLRRAREDEFRSDVPVVLVFVSSGCRVDRLEAWLEPLRTSHPVVQVFLDEPASELPAVRRLAP